jgi:hypothetical protein
MRTIPFLAVLAFLLVTAPSPCLALREIAPLTQAEAKAMGIELRAKPAGPEAVRLELEFKPEGKLKGFTHVELSLSEGEKSVVVFAELRERRTSSGNVVVSLTVGRTYLEKASLSVVMRDPKEAGDHTFELRMKDFVNPAKVELP